MQAVVQAWDGEAAQLFPRLFADYWERFSDLQSFFPYNPWDGESYARRAAWLDQAFTGDRGALAADLRDYQHQLDADAAALQQVELLAQPGTLVVVTGQQAGLLGGPLFTLYKAVTAIRLARELGEQLGRPVVPVFWIASDDHDFDEVRRAYLRDRRGRLRELALPGQRGRRPVGELPPPRRWLSLLREVEQALGERLHHRPVLERAEHIPADANWADAFGRLLAGLLSRYGLVILNPMRRPLRALLRDFFPLALLRKDSIHRELAAAATRLERRGYPPALAFDVEHSHLFLLEDGERVALQFQDGELVDRDGRVRLSLASALRLMDEEPWRFSPNVVLRSLAQDKLLPTLAYVAGPGEVGYLAQMRDVYPLFGLEMPVIAPRLSATLVPPDVAQRLWSLRMGAGAFLSGKAQAELKARLRELDTVGIEEQFSRLEQRLREAYGEAMAALRGISPHLERIGQANLERVLAQVRYFQGKAQAHHRRAHRQLLDAFTYAEAALRPRGQLQERIYSTLPVVAEFGDALIRSLLRPIPMAPHHLVIMEAEANLEATAPPVPQRLDGQVCR